MSKLREIVEARGFTQAQIAKELKVAQSTVSMWMTGARTPSLATAKKIVDYLETSVEDIFFTHHNHEKRLKQTDQAADEQSATPCCSNPAKPAAAPGNECKESSCCGLCQEDCNVRQPCRREGLSKTG